MRRGIKLSIFLLTLLVATISAGLTIWYFTVRPPAGTEIIAPGVPARSPYPRVPSIQNVVLISIDTCRADRLSCYGYPRPSTPNIDAVAREAVLFKQAIAPVPMTLPSHSSIMTGTYPPVHGVRGNDGYRLAPLSPDGQAGNVTLAKILRDAGYQTAAFVAGFPLDARFGLNQGFQTYDGQFGEEGSSHDRRSAEEVNRLGLAWLEAREKEPADPPLVPLSPGVIDTSGQHRVPRPFFLFLHYYDAHAPYQPPPPFDKIFADDPYAGGIAHVDAAIGQVIGRLRALGLYDNTLVIIVGDHGESLGEHGESTHSFFVYQSTLRVPLVIRAPGTCGGGKLQHREVEQTVNLVDLMPTVLSLLGLAQPERVEGADLRDSLEGRPRQGAAPASYFESLAPAAYNCCALQGLIEGRWKFIRAPRPELYDLERDPKEMDNVVMKDTDTARRLRDRLEEMLEAMKPAAAPGGSLLVDREAARRLESLGYVGGPAPRSEFDSHSEDPKDFAPVAAKIHDASELNRTGRFDEAKKAYLEIVALRPNLAPPYMILGEYANREKQPGEAISLLSKALSILTEARKKSTTMPSAVQNRQIAAVRSHLGISLLMQGKTAESLAELKAALALDPELADLQYDVGNVCAALGQTSEAIGHYRKAVELDPQHENAHHNLGTMLAASGRLDEAIGHFQRSLEIKPDNVRAQVSFADLLAGRGLVDQAIAHYRKALEIEPNDVDACNNLGFALAGRGKIDEAIALYRKTLQIRPDYAPAHNNLGLALAGRRQFDEAIAHYEKAIQIKPDFAAAHNNLGVALASGRGDMNAAIKHFHRALEIQPKYEGARQNLERARTQR
jgi:arylsulfatase A-like enzyme/Tfp pilus assembly protein PilF